MRGLDKPTVVATRIVLLLTACSSSTRIERVPVPPGSTVRAAAESLSAHGIIRSKAWFRLRARFSGGGSIKAGVYLIDRSTGIGDVLRRLRAGDAERLRVTLPIGGTLVDLSRSVETTLAIPADSLLAAANDSALLRDLGLPGRTAEGWLLPESFDFGGFDAARDVITRFVAARRQAWDSTWDRRAATQHLDREGLLALASIVEAEAKDPAERPIIAAVYRNRMKAGMPLQADPTIQYAYLVRDGARKHVSTTRTTCSIRHGTRTSESDCRRGRSATHHEKRSRQFSVRRESGFSTLSRDRTARVFSRRRTVNIYGTSRSFAANRRAALSTSGLPKIPLTTATPANPAAIAGSQSSGVTPPISTHGRLPALARIALAPSKPSAGPASSFVAV